ncbi:MAG TPA: hypothetical protein VLI92_05095 [Candidatus Saccharimonadales bacterium]|nr:hypothetical protein [Candidatus Saccharimonadales bacterium]
MADYLQESHDLIESILKKVVNAAPQGWEGITVDIDYSVPGVIDKKYSAKLGNETKTFMGPSDTIELIKLKTLNTSTEKGSLKSFKATISTDGKFDIKYGY